MYILNVLLLIIFLILLSYINSESSDEKEDEKENPLCSLNSDCDKCELCNNYLNCNYFNTFCYKRNTNDYKRNIELQNNLSLYYLNDSNTIKFCNPRNITLNKEQKYLTIFSSSSKELIKSYHCIYNIKNEYYFKQSIDHAKINFEIRKANMGINLRNNSEINFFLIFLYKIENNWRFFNFKDDQLRNSSFTKLLDQISEIEILLDFFSLNNTNNKVYENLILSISIENSIENLKKMYKIIIIILSILLFIIIILIIIFIYIQRKLVLEQERKIKEEAKKKEKQKKMLEDFLKNELKPQIYEEKININDYNSCTICCENFIIGQSEVSITPCFHLFHHECIQKWIQEKINNPFCPNCNFKFLEYLENPIKKIQIRSKNNLILNTKKKEKLIDENIFDPNLIKEKIIKFNTEEPPSSEHLKIVIEPFALMKDKCDTDDNNKSFYLNLHDNKNFKNIKNVKK